MKVRQRLILEVNDRMVAGMLCEVGKRSSTPLSSTFVHIEEKQGYLTAAGEVISQCRARSCSCYLSLPGSLFFFKDLDLPFTDRRKIDEVLRYELMDRISFSDEQFFFDSLVVERSPNRTRLRAAVVKEEELKPWLELLDAHAINPELVTVSPMGRVLHLMNTRSSDDRFMYLDAGRAESTCFLVKNGTIQTIRSVAGGADAGGFSLSKEVQRTVRARIPGWNEAKPIDLLIGGAMAGEIDVTSLTNADLFTGATVLDSGDRLISRDSTAAQLPDYVHKMLSATASLLPTDRLLLNLCGSGVKNSEKVKAIKQFVPVLASILVLLLLGSAYQLYDYYGLTRTHERLAEEAEQIYLQTLGEKQSPGDPLLLLKARINEIDASAIAGIVEHPEIRAVSVLADISNRLPASVQVSFDRFIFDRKTVRLNGLTDTYNNVDRIKKSLESSLLYTAVAIDSAGSSEAGNGITFALTLSL
jgi:general secretion pathway protein L